MPERIFRAYYVWPSFPSISISGEACALDCAHCSGLYLKDMVPATTPKKLIEVCEGLLILGAGGVLLSGGCDKKGGMLNLEKMLPAIKKIHDMGLIIKLHTGLVSDKLAGKIADAGVDIASMDASPEDYLATFERLADAGIPHVCPHVCVGLQFGKLNGELKALDMLASKIKPSTLAVLVLRPTKGTKMGKLAAPKGGDVRNVVAHARKLFPKTKIVLLALRPRGEKRPRTEIELGALAGGIDGAELPSAELLAEVKKRGYRVKKINAYGVLPTECEERVETCWL
jgi:uncharacterized radical SAM superfamily protein